MIGPLAFVGAALRFLAANRTATWVLLAIAAACVVWVAAGDRAKQAARVEQIEAAIEAGEIRRDANAEAIRSSDVELCVALGGLRDDCAARLLGPREAPAAE